MSLKNEIIAWLQSVLSINDTNGQKAFIIRAIPDPKLQNKIELGRDTSTFCSLLVHKLMSYGKFSDGRYAIDVLLETAKDSVGVEGKEECNNFLKRLRKSRQKSNSSDTKILQKDVCPGKNSTREPLFQKIPHDKSHDQNNHTSQTIMTNEPPKELFQQDTKANSEFKWAEKLLETDMMNWRTLRLLIPGEHLEVLYKRRERFRDLDNETLECLLRSALKARFIFEDWVTVANKVNETYLFTFLHDTNVEIRRRVAKALGNIGSPRAVKPLMTALKDKKSVVRQATATALGRLGDPQAMIPLMTALKDKKSVVRQAAATALGRLGDPQAMNPLMTALRDKDSDVGEAAARALCQLDESAIGSLITTLQDNDVDNSVRSLTTWVIGKLKDSRAIKPLITALQDKNEDGDVREVVAIALGQLDSPQAVEPLITTLQDKNEDDDVRKAAAIALGQLGSPQAVEPLITVLRNDGKDDDEDDDEDDDMRGTATLALGKLRDSRAIEPLITTLQDKDEDDDVRKAAAVALGRLGNPWAVEPLIIALQDDDIRLAAAIALGRLGNPWAVEPLIAVLQDADYSDLLEFLILGQLANCRADGLEDILEDIIPLKNCFWGDDFDVYLAVAKALKKIGTPEALTALKEYWFSEFGILEEEND